MNLLSELKASPLLMSLFASVLKSSAVFLAAWGGSLVLRRRSAALRHALWVAASACSLVLLILPATVPAWKVIPPLPATKTTAITASPKLPALSEQEAKSAEVKSAQVSRQSGRNTHAAAAIAESATGATPTAATVASTPLPVEHRLPMADAKLSVVALWAFISFLLLAFYAIGGCKLSRLARRAASVSEEDWTHASSCIASRLGVNRHVHLLHSAEIEVPITFGVVHPKIVLPADYAEWNAQRRDAVLLHETAHIARWDALTHHISQLASAIYWFNPLAWMAARNARFQRELACDDFVLAAGAAPSEYAGELLTMVSRFRQREHYAAALAMARRSQFEGRLLALLNPQQHRKPFSRNAAIGAFILAAAVALPLAAMAPQDPQSPAPPAQPQATTTSGNIIRPGGPTTPGPTQGVSGGIAGGTEGGVAGGVRANGPEPALAPHAEEAPANGVAAPMIAGAPEAESPTPRPSAGSFSAMTPRALSAEVGAAAPAPPAQTRPEHPAVMPPANRQTGLECVAGSEKQHSSSMSSDEGNYKSMVVSWSGGDCSASLNARGDIRFNDDFTAIQSISPDGFAEIDSRIHGQTRRLSIHPTAGQLEYVWWVNGNKEPFDDNARQWVKNFLIELDRHSAWAVKQRFPVLLKEGGASRVLDEVSYMSSDYARAVYLITLVNDVNLKSQELVQTLNRTSELSSDYETARVLLAIAGKYPLQDQGSRNAFLSAIDGINSDYEHARVLMAFFNKGPIPMEMGRAILNSASRLKSDYEHSRVLVEMATRGLVDAGTQADFLASVNRINSDYEHSRSLLAFLQSRKSDDAAVLGVIQSVPQIHSDYEAAHVLTTVAAEHNLSGVARDEYIKAARQIHSDYERNRALAAVGYKATSL